VRGGGTGTGRWEGQEDEGDREQGGTGRRDREEGGTGRGEVRRPVHAERGKRAMRGLNRCVNHT